MECAAGQAICVRGLTKDYGRGRGVFGVDLEVAPGEVLGFLGPNGAGKTVTVRHLMGFVRPQAGTATIFGRDCFAERPTIQRRLGYLPGENTCMTDMTAGAFLKLMADMRGLRDCTRMDELVSRFDLDMRARIGGMSKGNRQKVAIVAAFMARPDVLLLDEPTSGLDPLMQERFMELVEEERSSGAAILLSSHIFEEVERACDRVAFIRSGKVALTCTMDEVRSRRGSTYTIRFASEGECDRWKARHGGSGDADGAWSVADTLAAVHPAATVTLRDIRDVNLPIRELATYDVASLDVREQTLEELFLSLYENGAPSSPLGEVAASADANR